MDEADNANELVDAYLQAALSCCKQQFLTVTNKCYYCGEVTNEKLFCDAGCREDYEIQQLAKKRAGK